MSDSPTHTGSQIPSDHPLTKSEYDRTTEAIALGSGMNYRHLLDPEDKKLNARELRFVEAYVCGDDRSVNNAYRSAIVAGYSHETAAAWANKWTLDPRKYPGAEQGQKLHVFLAIERRRAELAERTALSEAAIVGEIRKVAMFNMASAFKTTSQGDPYVDVSTLSIDELAAIAEVNTEDFLDGRGEDAREVRKVRVKAHDKIAALDKLARVFGLYKPDRVIHSNDPDNPLGFSHDLAKLTEDELEVYMQLVRKMEGKETEEDKQSPILKPMKTVEAYRPFARGPLAIDGESPVPDDTKGLESTQQVAEAPSPRPSVEYDKDTPTFEEGTGS